MPNRVFYTGLLTSEKVNKLKSQEFELYVRLLLVVDDFGRYLGSSVRVARSCWPDREDLTSKQVEPILLRLSEVGLIVLYKDETARYLQITNWNQRTRATVSKYPPAPDSCQSNDGQVTVKCQTPDCSRVYDGDVDVDVDDRRRRIHMTVPLRGSQNNVKLTDEELEKLRTEFPDIADDAVEYLSMWMLEKGDKSKAPTHNVTIRRWVLDAVREKHAKLALNGKPAQKKPANMGNFEERAYSAKDMDGYYEDVTKLTADDLQGVAK